MVMAMAIVMVTVVTVAKEMAAIMARAVDMAMTMTMVGDKDTAMEEMQPRQQTAGIMPVGTILGFKPQTFAVTLN